MTEPAGTDVSTPGADVPSTVPGGPQVTPADTAALAARLRVLADDDFAGYCPAYERIARALADDDESLGLLLDAAPVGRTPVLALAAVHDLVLASPGSELAAAYRGDPGIDPWPPFRRLLHERTPDVLRRMRTRSIQTNEVGRSAALLPALAHVRDAARDAGDDRPLALVEIGPSAGLNLLLDRYAITYRRDGAVVAAAGDATSPVRIGCELRGPLDPPPVGRVPIAVRTGLDLAPVDVTDDDACRWLSACVWPGVPDRPERLAAAIRLARSAPPRLRVGDAVTDLAPLVAELGPEVLPVVISTWAIAYLGRDGRAAVLDALDDLGRRRELALLTAEEPRVTPWVPPVPPEVAAAGDGEGEGTATLLGLRTWRAGSARDEALALCHPHLRWMAWAAPEGST